MSEELQTGLLLFVVGMVTVFTVLCIVVLTGKSLIYLVDRFSDRTSPGRVRKRVMQAGESAIQPKTMAAITAAITAATGGSARPVHVQKVK